MRRFHVIIYGAYGYTGKLITEECKRRGFNVLLSGRDDVRLKDLSLKTEYPYEACEINATSSLLTLLRKGSVVIHCAGPFQSTAKQMLEACLECQTHYLDITGEFTVFEMLAGYDAIAKQKGILIMPGVGFDVVPSDCLAVHLKNLLPGASHLQLAFTMSKGGMSRGTARTMIDGLGYGSMIRANGILTPIGLGDRILEIDFGAFKRKAICIPWGDIATAWRSTGIPNIEVYSAVSERMIRIAKVSRYVNWLLRKQWIKRYLKRKVDVKPEGPDRDKLDSGASFLWGRARDMQGAVVEARLKTASGYLLTARAATHITAKLRGADVRPGYFTPAQYFGPNLIHEIDGSEWINY